MFLDVVKRLTVCCWLGFPSRICEYGGLVEIWKVGGTFGSEHWISVVLDDNLHRNKVVGGAGSEVCYHLFFSVDRVTWWDSQLTAPACGDWHLNRTRGFPIAGRSGRVPCAMISWCPMVSHLGRRQVRRKMRRQRWGAAHKQKTWRACFSSSEEPH